MSFTNLTSARLRRLVALIKKKESLQARLDEVVRSIEKFDTGGTTKESTPVKAGPRKSKRRGKLKKRLLKLLQAAGGKGLTVKELAQSLKAKPGSVSVWFYTTGKKIDGIKKVGPARFAYLPK